MTVLQRHRYLSVILAASISTGKFFTCGDTSYCHEGIVSFARRSVR